MLTGNCSIIDVPFGNYWAVETVTPPNHATAADQSFTLTAGNATVTLTFVNVRQTGAILVTKTRKHAAAGPGDHPHAGVNFTVNGVTKATDANGQACFDGLLPGAYTVHETVPAGYHVRRERQVGDREQRSHLRGHPVRGETVSFSNTPLTDLTVSVNSQVAGGTNSKITCTGLIPTRQTQRRTPSTTRRRRSMTSSRARTPAPS